MNFSMLHIAYTFLAVLETVTQTSCCLVPLPIHSTVCLSVAKSYTIAFEGYYIIYNKKQVALVVINTGTRNENGVLINIIY